MGGALVRGWAHVNILAIRVGYYSRWALISCWALIQIKTGSHVINYCTRNQRVQVVFKAEPYKIICGVIFLRPDSNVALYMC